MSAAVLDLHLKLTFSAFWGSLAFTLIGGTIGGTVLTLLFLPPLYAIWFGIRPEAERAAHRFILQARLTLPTARMASSC